MEKDNEELALEALLFGTEVVQINEPQENTERNPEELADKDLFIIDKPSKRSKKTKSVKTSVWHDEEDDRLTVDITSVNRLRKLRKTASETTISALEYQERLKQQFQKTHGNPEWASFVDGKEVDGLDFLKSSLGIQLKAQVSKTLSHDTIEVVRVKDANFSSYSDAVIQTSMFHPSAPVLMTSGYDKTIKLFHIDGNSNTKIQSVFLKNLPLHSTAFTTDGRQIICSGRRPYFYVYDIESCRTEKISCIRGRKEKSLENFRMSPCNLYILFLGSEGHIIVVSRETKQWVANLKMNCNVVDLCFSSSGKYCYSLGETGEIYQWDMDTKLCIRIVIDNGAIHSTKISLSPNDEYLAIGSKSGIVNIYSMADCFSHSQVQTKKVNPVKLIKNLTTSIHLLKFHPSSQILAIASRQKKDAMRLVHLPSFKVYKNWPTANTPLSSVNAIDFSPEGGFLSIGNEKGKVLLYQLTAFMKE